MEYRPKSSDSFVNLIFFRVIFTIWLAHNPTNSLLRPFERDKKNVAIHTHTPTNAFWRVKKNKNFVLCNDQFILIELDSSHLIWLTATRQTKTKVSLFYEKPLFDFLELFVWHIHRNGNQTACQVKCWIWNLLLQVFGSVKSFKYVLKSFSNPSFYEFCIELILYTLKCHYISNFIVFFSPLHCRRIDLCNEYLSNDRWTWNINQNKKPYQNMW